MASCVLCERYKQGSPRPFEATEEVVGLSKSIKVTCIRCGTYAIERSIVEDNPSGLSEGVGLALSGLARAATDEGRLITFERETYGALAAGAPVPKSFSGYIERVLLDLAKRCKYPGQFATGQVMEELAARAYLPPAPYFALLKQLEGEKLLRVGNPDPLRLAVQLEPDGWSRVDQYTARRPQSHRAFVAMWFAEQMRPAFTEGIKLALEECGYEGPFRVDDPEHEAMASEPDYHPKIDDRIMAEIRRSRFVVADMSGGRNAVYYEAGFAVGLNIPVIWTCRSATAAQDMCFDTRQIEHIIWDRPQDLYERLRDKIRARGWDRRLVRAT